MSTITNFGTWYNHQGHDLTIEQSTAETLGDVADDYDVDAIARDWQTAINAALPDGVDLVGSEFYGPAYPQDRTWTGELDITAVIEGVDFWEIAARHEQWTVDQVADHLGYKTATANATARKKLSAWGVKAAGHRPDPESGRVKARYNAREVEAAQKSRPGQGARTDRTE